MKKAKLIKKFLRKTKVIVLKREYRQAKKEYKKLNHSDKGQISREMKIKLNEPNRKNSLEVK